MANRRIRNYKAMLDEKLLSCQWQLQNHGEAYERAINSGSGDPARDLRVVTQELRARGLLYA